MYLLGLIGIIIGLTIGILVAIKTKKRYQQKNFQNDLLKKKIHTLNAQQQEIKNHFHQNIMLLNTIIKNCQDLYQNMTQSANIFSYQNNNKKIEEHHSHNINHPNNLTDCDDYSMIDNNQYLTQEPRDYPENNNNHFK